MFCLLGLVGALAAIGLSRNLSAPAQVRAAGGAAIGSRIMIVPRPRRIVAVSPQGAARTLLFRAGDGQIIGPAATPDGRHVAFILRRSPRPVPGSDRVAIVRDEIWTMHADGGEAHPIRVFTRRKRGCCNWISPSSGARGAQGGLTSIDISDDGTRLVIAKGNWDAYTLRIDGTELRYVNVVGARFSGYTGSDTAGPQFAHGGRRLIAHFETSRGESIGTVPLHGGRVSLIRTSRHGLSATYSDDGRRIAYVVIGPSPAAHPRQEGRHAIWMMRADGTRARQIAARPGLSFANPDFSPDGRHLVFTSDRASEIGRKAVATYTMSVDGGPLKRVARGVVRFYVDNPEWVGLK
jgi:WD40-like Beta Propeller Repeat